eukprot:TRINITY_DN9057_c0_g2_i1.p1 TRINITY_DN9057_c0_g2~~TRINITY_DN9057_c0_g2_i1.p1  ORF type:complete len:1474 (+),score=328.38 TRINITY_DN9057_c0_g2_i1:58-4479(+)
MTARHTALLAVALCAQQSMSCQFPSDWRYLRISNGGPVQTTTCSASWDIHELRVFDSTNHPVLYSVDSHAACDMSCNLRALEDDDPSTYWAADPGLIELGAACWVASKIGLQWITLDLGSVQAVENVQVEQHGADYAVPSIQIECSNDNQTWTSPLIASTPLGISNAGSTWSPTLSPTESPTHSPSVVPTTTPSVSPTTPPSLQPTSPTASPTHSPSPTRYQCVPSGSGQLECMPSGGSGQFDRPNCSGICPALSRVPPAPPPLPPPPPPGQSLPPSASPSGAAPTSAPTQAPVLLPTARPLPGMTLDPTASPSVIPTMSPSRPPTAAPSHSPTWVPSEGPTESPTLRPSPAPSEVPSYAPSDAPSATPSGAPTGSPSRAPSADSCAALRCQGATECRGASRCVAAAGAAFCVPGDSAADGTNCSDGHDSTQNDSCSAGVCFGFPVGCVLTDECSKGHDPQCGSLACRSGRCRRLTANEGRPCDDRSQATARDVCSKGACVGVDLCQGVVCSAADDCRERGQCNSSDGRCVQRHRKDGTRCRKLDVAVAEDECLRGECTAFAAMRIAEIAMEDESGESVAAVAVILPGSPLSPARTACDAVDGSPDTDLVDRRVARVRSGDAAGIGTQELLLSSLSGDSYGDLVVVFSTPVALAAVEVTDSARNPAQSPTRGRLSGCVAGAAAEDAIRLAAAAAHCGGAEPTQQQLDRLDAALDEAVWVSMATNTSESGTEARRFAVSAAEKHLCIRWHPEALRGGCGAACGAGSQGGVRVRVARMGAGLLVVLIASGLLLGALVGCRLKPADDSVPVPLTGREVGEVLQLCRDAYEPLAARWRRSQRCLVEEMVARAVVPDGERGTAAECLRGLIAQQWRRGLAEKWPQLAALPSAVLAALRLYSQEPQDIDREMGWRDAPRPTPESGGHGLPTARDRDAWTQYKLAHKDTNEARNQSHYRMPNRASFELCGSHRWSSLDQYEDWVKYVAALLWAASVGRPVAEGGAATRAAAAASPGAGGGLLLSRMLGRLPATVRQGYAALHPGWFFALPSLSSTSSAAEAGAEFMGQHPGYAVLLRLHFPAGHEVGIDMKPISMYPLESEVLLPMFAVFCVTAISRPRRLDGIVERKPVEGFRDCCLHAVLSLRAALRPLLVVEAEFVGTLDKLDADAARWMDEVAADAVRSSAILESSMPWADSLRAHPPPQGEGAAAAEAAELRQRLERAEHQDREKGIVLGKAISALQLRDKEAREQSAIIQQLQRQSTAQLGALAPTQMQRRATADTAGDAPQDYSAAAGLASRAPQIQRVHTLDLASSTQVSRRPTAGLAPATPPQVLRQLTAGAAPGSPLAPARGPAPMQPPRIPPTSASPRVARATSGPQGSAAVQPPRTVPTVPSPQHDPLLRTLSADSPLQGAPAAAQRLSLGRAPPARPPGAPLTPQEQLRQPLLPLPQLTVPLQRQVSLPQPVAPGLRPRGLGRSSLL